MWRSVPQIEAAATSTRTSPGPGVGTGTSTSSRPGPGADLRSASMVVGSGSVTAEAYFPRSRTRAHARPAVSGECGDPRATSTVGRTRGRRRGRGSRRHDLVDRVERRVVEPDVGAGERSSSWSIVFGPMMSRSRRDAPARTRAPCASSRCRRRPRPSPAPRPGRTCAGCRVAHVEPPRDGVPANRWRAVGARALRDVLVAAVLAGEPAAGERAPRRARPSRSAASRGSRSTSMCRGEDRVRRLLA